MVDHRSEMLILQVLKSRQTTLTLEELIRNVPELTWNEVFSAVDTLSRRQLITLKRHGFDYALSYMREQTSSL